MTAFTSVRRTALGALTVLAGALFAAPAQAQNYPVTSGQRATAQQVAFKAIVKVSMHLASLSANTTTALFRQIANNAAFVLMVLKPCCVGLK